MQMALGHHAFAGLIDLAVNAGLHRGILTPSDKRMLPLLMKRGNAKQRAIRNASDERAYAMMKISQQDTKIIVWVA
ncbi:hypothetical protein MHYP_G00174570 [Metynnis hypsauchen]